MRLTPRAPAAGTYRSLWAHRRCRWLIASLSSSLIGTFVYSVALVVFVMELTGSAAWVSAAVIARIVPFAVLGAPAGVLADRFDRRQLMVLLEVIRAALAVSAALVAFTGGSPGLAVAMATASSVAATPYRPAFVAVLPHLVDQRDLPAANAASNLVGQTAWFVGPAVAAAALSVANVTTAFLVAAVAHGAAAFLVQRTGDVGGGKGLSASFTSSQATTGPSLVQEVDTRNRTSRTIMGDELLDGLRAVRSDPGLTALLLLVCALLFTFGMEQVLFVLVAADRLDLGPEGFGLLAAAVGAGALLTAPFTARIGRARRPVAVLVASSVLAGAPLIALSFTDSIVLTLGLLTIEGAATFVSEVMLVTMLQRSCPDHLLARVVGLQESASAVTQVLGSAIAPVLVAVSGLRVSLWVGGAVTVIASLVLAARLRPLAKHIPTTQSS